MDAVHPTHPADDPGEDPGPGADLARAFAAPARDIRPKIYLFPPAVDAIGAAELSRAIEQIAAAGFGGVNLFDLDIAPTARRNDLLRSALETARRVGIAVDPTIHNTARFPEVTADSGVDQQEIAYGTAAIGGGTVYSGPVPEPATDPERPRTLVAVVAARRAAGGADAPDGADGAPVLLDRAGLADLTKDAEDGRITWTAPEGDWLLFGVWRRSTESPYADYFSARGTDAMTAYWDEQVFTPEIQKLVDEVDDTLFEDSLHLQGYQLWTPDLLAEFERRRGYSLRPYLPVVFIPHLNDWVANTFRAPQTRHPDTPADHDFADGTGARIRNDYYRTLSELYEEHHLRPLNAWARSHGLRYRPKPSYNATLDISAAAAVEVPNTENFAMGNRLDGIRAIAGAAHMGRRRRLVVETAPTTTRVGHDLYSTTWRQALSAAHGAFAGGANHAELHSFAYPRGPRSFGVSADGPEADWPGFWSYMGTSMPDVVGPLGLAEAYGPRMPYWAHTPDVTAFLAREQFVLQQGRPRVDVAVYRHSYWSHGFPYTANHSADDHFRWFTDTTMERLGYTYEFIGPALLDLPGARVAGGRLDPEGPAYKALVLDFAGQRAGVRGMPAAAARAVLDHARAGLPVIVVGELPDSTGFFGDAGDDADVRAALAALLATPGVRRVAAEDAVPDALAAAGVRPDFSPAAPSNVVGVHRADDRADFHFLYNQNGVNNMTGAPEPEPAPFDQTVALAGSGRPYRLDAWTGAIEPVAAYRSDGTGGGRITTRVRLAPGETALIAIVRDTVPDRVHAVESTADDLAVGSDGGVLVRAAAPGTHTVAFSNGRTAVAVVGALPDVATLSPWHLAVEDWLPGPDAAQTRVERHELRLDALAPWPDIPELRDVSGIGRYTAHVELGADWARNGNRARLDLGAVSDSVRVRINGELLPPVDPHRPVAEATAYLRTGHNTVEIEIATTLRNRLRTLDTHPAFAAAERQPYGLVGPVLLVPYGEAAVGLPA
ncbi:alpha-L-rhamnosidase-like protein [Murinocardiopsis flavida]|uniref:Alpha-L-rhamnosidase-like protein n=1 Tax=Murinocardiopsis flavida TaxID=645275 RepID=A0A2P8CJ70_9ACTN|nr:glycosyl hydrolase [Murinocardiopsis flavida]PSK85017.1 alpha-L-rhamnosidase-like protein [Murinocardiopsis flavida]